jgi:Type IV pilus assembly protein PilM
MPVAVIEWDRERLILAQGAIDGSRIAFDSLQVVERSADAPVTNEVLSVIRDTIPATGGKQRRKVTLVFPRQSFTTYRIELPRVPDDEIPDMVSLQAAMRLSVPVENVCLDYVPLPTPSHSDTCDVLLVTVPREHVDAAREVVETCGLEIGEIRVSAFCAATAAVRAGILKQQEDSRTVDVLVLLRRDFIEVTFVRGTSVLFSHSGASWSTSAEIEPCVRAELAKARMAASESLGDHRLGRVVLIGNPEATSAVTDQLTARLDNAVLERIDPAEAFVSTQLPSEVPAAAMVNVAGAIAAQTDSTVPAIDLLNPRRAPEKRDLRRVKVLGGSLAAVVFFAAAFFWRSGRLTEAQDNLAAIQAEVRELTSAVKSGEDERERAAAVREWVARDINWLDQVDALRTLIGSTEYIYVRDLAFDVKSGQDLGTIRVDGYAKSRAEVENLGRRLTDAGYNVIVDSEPFGRDGYRIRMTIDIVIPVEPLEFQTDSERPGNSAS